MTRQDSESQPLPAPAGLRSQLARGITSLYVVQLLALPLSIATNLFAGRFLEPSDYGLFATAIFIVSLGSLLGDANLVTALIRDPRPLEEKDYAAAFAYQAGAGLAGGLLLIAGASAVGVFFGEYAEAARMIRWLALTPFLSSLLTVPLVKLERELRYGRIALLSLGWSVGERILLIALMVGQLKGFAYVYSRIAGILLQALTLYWIARWSPRALLLAVFRDGWQGGERLRFGLTLTFKNASGYLVNSVIPGLGGRLFGAEAVGLVAWSHTMASTIGLQLPQAAGRVLTGASSRLGGSPEELKRYLEEALLICSVLVGLVMAILATTMPELLHYAFKPRWHEAAPFFTISSLTIGMAVLFTFYDVQMVILGHSMVTAVANWAWGVFILAISAVLALRLGPPGLLWGHLLSVFLPIAILHRRSRQLCPIRLGRNFVLPFAVSALLGGACWRLKTYFVAGIPSLVAFDAAAFAVGLGAQLACQPILLKAARDIIGLRRTSRGTSP